MVEGGAVHPRRSRHQSRRGSCYCLGRCFFPAMLSDCRAENAGRICLRTQLRTVLSSPAWVLLTGTSPVCKLLRKPRRIIARNFGSSTPRPSNCSGGKTYREVCEELNRLGYRRLVWRSSGFLTKNKDRLWQEQRAEWYPQPVVVAVSHVQGSNPEGKQTATMKPTSPTTAPWPERLPVSLLSRLPVSVVSAATFGRNRRPLHGVRAVQTTRGP